jgi:hypothetical protein
LCIDDVVDGVAVVVVDDVLDLLDDHLDLAEAPLDDRSANMYQRLH